MPSYAKKLASSGTYISLLGAGMKTWCRSDAWLRGWTPTAFSRTGTPFCLSTWTSGNLIDPRCTASCNVCAGWRSGVSSCCFAGRVQDVLAQSKYGSDGSLLTSCEHAACGPLWRHTGQDDSDEPGQLAEPESHLSGGWRSIAQGCGRTRSLCRDHQAGKLVQVAAWACALA